MIETRWTKRLCGLFLAAVVISVHASRRELTAAETTDAAELTVVVFGGHPDDPESAAGGLIATLTRGGHDVIAAYGTAFRGQRKFFDRPEAEVRRGEAIAACKILGATPKFFDFAHEDLFADRDALDEVSAWLDEVKPDIVITHWPLDMHPNHHVVSSLVWQSYRREGGWNLYFFEVMTGQQSIGFEPDLFLDIAHVRNIKRLALSTHKSQAPESIWAVHEEMHRRRGTECGVTHAEAYSLVEAKPGCALLPVKFLPKAALEPQTQAIHVWPTEPIDIGTEPQFLIDNYVVDNHWALKQPAETVRRVFHPGKKHAENPVIAQDGGYVSVLKDDETGLFRMWYQTYLGPPKPGREDWHEYVTSYAESQDGLSWNLPKLGLIEWQGTKENNFVWRGVDPKWYMGEAPYILDVPESARRGYRYVMFYHDIRKLSLVGSHDGIHWDKSSVMKLTSIPSDSHNTIVYDPRREKYVMYLRSRPHYGPVDGTNINVGHSRRVARMTSKELWTDWGTSAQNILIPDEKDADQGFTHFYGMPVRHYAGIYWGFLWPYRPETFLHTELAWSRDGTRFERLPNRPQLIKRGPKGSWDYGMVSSSGSQWIEVGDEWWLYYCGNDGPHNTQTKAGIGLIKFRKEGFISMRGPASGGFIATRTILWPGGTLLVNADAREGDLRVRVTDKKWKVLPGFDYSDCAAFRTNAASHEIKWKKKSISELNGQVIRLEFSLRSADLYTFRATDVPPSVDKTD